LSSSRPVTEAPCNLQFMPSETVAPWPLRDALITALAVLDNKLGIIEGSRELAKYAHSVVADWRTDPDLVVFGALASETDHLPFSTVRDRWSAEGLAKADAEIDAITRRNHDKVRRECENLIARFGPGKRTVTLYRPIGPQELDLIAASGWREFPPRLPGQPIFYPVTNEAYATRIARDWNVRENGAGFATKFEVDAYYLSRFTVQKVGGAIHTEYWIPAEDLPEFNQHIVGKIAVTAEFR
jgi:hypothetical protein